MQKSANIPDIHLEFIDVLAYYIPGTIVIASGVLWDKVLGLGLVGVARTTFGIVEEKSGYVEGLLWTVLSLTVPYVLGHLIYPASLCVSDPALHVRKLPLNIQNCTLM